MKKVFPKIFFVLAVLLSICGKIHASHIYGEDISCAYVSGTSYLITVQAYQDCNNSTQPASGIDMTYPSGSGTISLGGSYCCAKDITPHASNICDVCTNSVCSFGFGIKRWICTVTVDLSKYSDCNFVFSWNNCCDGNGNNQYVECSLNRCNGDQSGPVYNSDPVTLLCINAPFEGYQSVIPGGKADSVRYYLTESMSYKGNTIGLPAPYTYKTPITYNGTDPDAAFKLPLALGFHYNANTGELQFKPVKTETSWMALKADEYRKDKSGKYYLSGSTMRSVAINIVNCSGNYLPYITGINGGTSDTITTCANVPLNINFRTYDFVGDTLTLTANNQTGGIIYYGGNAVKGKIKWPVDTLKWTPGIKDVSSYPHLLTLTVSNRSTPVPVQHQRKFYIFVTDSFPATGISIADSGCGKYHLGLTKPVDKNYKLTYQWMVDGDSVSTNDNYSFHTTKAGRHPVSLTITKPGSCTRTFYDTIQYDMAYHTLSTVSGLCKGSSIQLTAVNQKNLLWSPGKGLTDSTIYNPFASPVATTLYTVTGKDKAGCTFTDQTKIVVSDYSIKTSGDKHVCKSEGVKAFSTSIIGAKIQWFAGKDSLYGYDSDTVYLAATKTTTFKAVVNYNGCIKSDSITLFIPPPPDLGGPEKKVCANDAVTLHVSGGSNYKWFNITHPNILLSTGPDYQIIRATNTVTGYPIEAIVTDSLTGCTDTGFILIKVSKPIHDSLSAYKAAICPGNFATFYAFGGNKYKWQLPGGKFSTNNYISVSPTVPTEYRVTISDTVYGCSVIDSVNVYASPSSSVYPPKNICLGDTAIFSAHGGSKYQWWPPTGITNIYGSVQKAAPTSTTNYSVQIIDSVTGCLRTDSIKVMVYKDCVWPGDANRDGYANYLDVLNIGLGNGVTGPARAPGTTSWKSYPATNWGKIMIDSIDYKHTDCNGDGVINATDTSIITKNYHQKSYATLSNPANPPLYFQFAKDTFYSGDTITAYLFAGEKKKPLKNAYGVGYQFSYTVAQMIESSLNYQPYCDLFCSGSEINYIYPDYADHEMEATVVETNRIGTAGSFGKIGELSLRLKDSLSYAYNNGKGDIIYLKALSAKAIDSTGKEIKMYPGTASAIVLKSKKKIDSTVGIHYPTQIKGINIYPNPADKELIIESEGSNISLLVLQNSLGQRIFYINPKATKTRLDVSYLSTGIYFLEIKINENVLMQKIIISR